MAEWLIKEVGVAYAIPTLITYLVLHPYIVYFVRRRGTAPRPPTRWWVSVMALCFAAAWVFVYRLLIYPPRPTPAGKIGVWVARSEGDSFNRLHSDVLRNLENQADASDLYNRVVVRDLKRELPHGTTHEQAKDAVQLAKQVRADVVLWLVIGKEDEFLYIVFPDDTSPTPLDLTELYKHDTRGLLRYLVAERYFEKKEYARSISIFSTIEESDLPVPAELYEAECYLQFQSELGNARNRRKAAEDGIEVLKRFFSRNPQGSDAIINYGKASSLDGFLHKVLAEDAPNSREESVKNIDQSILSFNNTLLSLSKESAPHTWAGAQLGLGDALISADEIMLTEPTNAQNAISAYNQALSIFKEEDFPFEYALTEEGLCLAEGDLAHFERAINYCSIAARVFRSLDAQHEFVKVNTHLGDMYTQSFEMDGAESLGKAEETYRFALELSKKHGFQASEADALAGICSIGIYQTDLEKLTEASDACVSVAESTDRNLNPMRYAATEVRFGLIQSVLSSKIPWKRLELLKQSRGAFAEAVRSLESLPATASVKRERVAAIANLRICDARISSIH